MHRARDVGLAGTLLAVMVSLPGAAGKAWCVVLSPVFPGTETLNYLAFSLLSKKYLTHLSNTIWTALPAASSRTSGWKPILLNDTLWRIVRDYMEKERKEQTPLNFISYFSRASICTSPLVKDNKEVNKAGEKGAKPLWEILKTFIFFQTFLAKNPTSLKWSQNPK